MIYKTKESSGKMKKQKEQTTKKNRLGVGGTFIEL